MKRLLSGLLVVSLIFVGGAAFAAATSDVVVNPVPINYDIRGASGVSVQSLGVLLGDVGSKSDPYLTKLVLSLREEIIRKVPPGDKVTIAYVSLRFAQAAGASDVQALSSVTYALEEGELLYSFSEERFVYLRNRIYSFASATDEFLHEIKGDGSVSFVSVRGMSVGGNEVSSGGGCSMLTLGAVVLFLLPAFAVVKRAKK